MPRETRELGARGFTRLCSAGDRVDPADWSGTCCRTVSVTYTGWLFGSDYRTATDHLGEWQFGFTGRFGVIFAGP